LLNTRTLEKVKTWLVKACYFATSRHLEGGTPVES
jgi:hypothetical protein